MFRPFFLYVYISAVLSNTPQTLSSVNTGMLVWNCKLIVYSTVGQSPNPNGNSNETVKMNGMSFSGCSSLKELALGILHHNII